MKRLLLGVALIAAPSARAYDSIRFLDPIKGGDIARPVAAASSADRIYVLDEKKSALLVFDALGAVLKTAGGAGQADGKFSEPRGVAVGPNGRVYVADTGNNRIQILDRDGAFVAAFGSKGSEAGRLRGPQSVAVGADGRIYVADTGNDRIQVFTEEGILLEQIGTPGSLAGQFRGPSRVNVDATDAVYVLDKGNDRIQKFDAAAKPVQQFALSGTDFVVDAYGFLYILDGGNGKVVEESPAGNPIGKFGSYGTGIGQLKKAEGIAVSPTGGLLVLDTGNARAHRVELTNKLKTTPVPANPAAKLLVSGPAKQWPVAATALSVLGDDVYAYLPVTGPFVKLGPDGKEIGRFGSVKGKGGEVTHSAGGLAASDKLGLFVSDTSENRIQHFSTSGQWQGNVGESSGFFDSRQKEGRVIHPAGVAINEDGTVYVADTGNRRIDAFSPDGVFVFSIGPKVGPYTLQEPVAVAWDKTGFLFFVDKSLKKVFKVEPSGAFLAAWGEEGSGPGNFKAPAAIAFDGQNYLYVLDTALNRVTVLTREGRWLTDFFAAGKQSGELVEPTALAILRNQLLIADKGRGRLLAFDLHPKLGAPVSVSSSTKEGVVTLSWTPVEDPWTAGYQISRASSAAGPFAVVGSVREERFSDSEVSANEKYWYRVATVSKTKDVGAWSRSVETFVAGAVNRAPVEISTAAIGNIFAANYKWYLKHPVGKVSVTNNVNVPFLNVKVTFKLKDYMDFGFDTEIKKLEAKQTVDIPLIATLNNKVLEVTEDTPIQAEFSLSYFEDGAARTASLTKPLRLYSRNAITWDDTRKIANFVTYKDDPVKSFKAASGGDFKNSKAEALNPAVLKALKVWNALGEYGIKFAANPANPFETAHDDPNFPVDYTQYPRETLKRKSGQCSDLTSLYAALLMDSEVRTALLDYPGHITLMFDTEADDAAEAGLPADMLVEHDGTMWVPVEVTSVGKPFTEAISKAAYAYKEEAAKGKVKVIDLESTFAEYEPVSMPPTDFTPAAPSAAALEKRFDEQVDALAKERHELLVKLAASALRKNPKDGEAQVQLGLAELQFGDRAAAKTAFEAALSLDSSDAAAANNLGSVDFLSGDYVGAEARFLQAAQLDGADGDVWLNLTKSAAKLKKADKAREYGAKAASATPEYRPIVDALVKSL
jgi:sugar lactone lactonase YvrE/tetratricopeptide (TPR) repeat protein